MHGALFGKKSEEQIAIEEMLSKFFAEELPPSYLQRRCASPGKSDTQLISKIRDFGVFDLCRDGGLDELSVIAYCCGKGMLPEALIDLLFGGPYFLTSLAPRLGPLTRDRYISGAAFAAIGIEWPEWPLVLDSHADHFLLSGEVHAVPAVEALEALVVCSQSGMFWLDLGDSRIVGEEEPTVDITIPRKFLRFDRAPAIRISGVKGEDVALLFRLIHLMSLVGAIERALEKSIEYVKGRKQFGVPIGGFQAVQRLIVDMRVAFDGLYSLCRFAVWSYTHSAEQYELATLAAIQCACDCAVPILEKAIQAHGGIGFTWEYELHLILRRALFFRAMYGISSEEQKLLLKRAAHG